MVDCFNCLKIDHFDDSKMGRWLSLVSLVCWLSGGLDDWMVLWLFWLTDRMVFRWVSMSDFYSR